MYGGEEEELYIRRSSKSDLYSLFTNTYLLQRTHSPLPETIH